MIKKYNNYDFLRLFLATSVVWHHFLLLTDQSLSVWLFDIVDREMAVKAFFVISGTLIWESGKRTPSPIEYIKKRALRLYPAYIMVLALIVILGASFFSSTLEDSVSYLFWNILFLNFMSPCLGAMFDQNLTCAVNGSLWTLKLEVAYYIFVAFSLYIMRRYAIKILIGFTILSIFLNLFVDLFWPSIMDGPLGHQIPFMFFYFGLGALVGDKVEELSKLQLMAGFFIVCLLYFIDTFFYPLFVLGLVFFVAYGLPFIIDIRKIGDLSYGLYIIHFPLIQLLISFDFFNGNLFRDMTLMFIILFIMASISWHFIEKPALNRIKRKKV